ncbi:MAG: LacI family DNA-binding transcriptional regulator [Bacteroidota bacterium]
MAVTIYDIAERAGVSIATVSRVLNNHRRVADRTRRRVLSIADDLGYQPHASAQSLARRQTRLVSVVLPMMTNYFFVEVMRSLQEYLAEHEFDLLVHASATLDGVDAQLDRAVQKGLSDGILLFSTPTTEARTQRLRRCGRPVVLVDCAHPGFDSVTTDNQAGGYLATRCLLDLGRRRIALLMANPASVPSKDRAAGYRRALCDAGLVADERLIAVSTDDAEHGYTEYGGYVSMQRLLAHSDDRPDAVFATSDVQALGALRAIQEHGLQVPHDIALIGFDDIQISRYVGLTTLRQPMAEIGRQAAKLVLQRIEAPERPSSQTVFAPRLIHRSTTQTGTTNGVGP